MASLLDQDFPDEEEDDFNPAPEEESDAEEDARPQGAGSDDDDVRTGRNHQARNARNGRTGDAKGGRKDNSAGPVSQDEAEEDDEDEEQIEGVGRGFEEQDDEDEEEEEEDDQDDDIEGQPSRKRHKKQRRNQFLDVEAEVDEDDEEDLDEEDELLPEETHPDDAQDLPRGADTDDRAHRELDAMRERQEQLTVEEEAARLKERYGRQAKASASAGAIIPQRLLLPGVEDPRIWRMKCRPGKEKEIIFALTEKIAQRASSRDPIFILSAFERGGPMAGNLYVEALRQDHIIAALEGVSHVFLGTKPFMVPLEEMPDLLRVKKSKELQPGMYVRIRRGLYSGDLGQVDEVEANGTDVTLRLVPRLEYGLNEDANAPAEIDAGTGKRKRTTKASGARPPARLFSETDARKRHSRYLSRAAGMRGNHFTYQGKEYLDGFLIDVFRINNLQVENVNPTLEEVTKFAAGAEDGTENLDLAALAATLKQSAATDYLPGDKVELFRGEQKGVTGRAVEVYGDIVKMRVDSSGDLKGQTIEAPIKDLRKLFKEGDHVKVIGGSKYTDEVGMVVRIKDDRVTILTDSNQQEVTVFSKDLREATDSGGTVAGSKYGILELVQLDAATVGCIIKIDRESLRVLDQSGSLRTLLPSSISNRLERRRNAVATDHDGNEIKNDDTVKEFSGEQRQGRVLHVHRNFVFVQNRERTENAGVFVARQTNVVTIAAKGARGANGSLDLAKMNPAMQPGSSGRAAPGGMAPPQSKGRDRLIGKSVKIRVGNDKGKIGIVKDVEGNTITVELHARNKKINMSRDSLTVVDAKTGKTIDSANNFSMGVRPQTMRTPASGGLGAGTVYGASGGRTPAYAMAIGGRTPAWKADAGARTPGYGGQTAYGGGQTAYGGQTSYGGQCHGTNPMPPRDPNT